MARIRSLKPEFWTDMRLARLPAMSRLVFLCLISMADDEGRIEGDAETVWHFGFPRESVEDVTSALRTLVECSRIVLYRGDDGVPVVAIPTFRRHQRVDRPYPSKLPAPPTLTKDSTNVRRMIDERSAQDWSGAGIGMEGSGSTKQVPAQAGDRLVSDPPTADPKPTKAKPLPPLATLWNRIASDAGLPQVASFTASRDRTTKAALVEEPDLGVWERAFRAIASDKFNRGGNDRHWRADFDYAIRPSKRGKWLDEARNATPTGAEPAPMTPEEQAADAAARRERTHRVLYGTKGA